MAVATLLSNIAGVSDHRIIIAVILTVPVGIGWMAWEYAGVVRRRRLFTGRALEDESDVLSQYDLRNSEQKQFVKDLLEALALDIGVNWTQLRATDTFERQLRVGRHYRSYDDLEETEQCVCQWATRQGIILSELPPFEGQLGVYVDRLFLIADRLNSGEGRSAAPRHVSGL